ncbi:HD domain-containing protein [Exiguobacterium flavidum]|uniref:HD domain-containing protein n=1 Tax=Exiguobacterium flavidum TaxID=2184695 RepID=UPI000DF77E37|nr:HD domain-containing protein [Exiguobacterium flavidum]
MKGIGQLSIGEMLDQRVMIKQAVKGIAANGKPYLTLILSDKTGEIETKMWDTSDIDKYAPRSIVHAAGEVMDYRGRTQLKLKQITVLEEKNVEDYLQAAPIPREELETEVLAYIESIKNPDMKKLVKHLVTREFDAYFTHPAAVKNHHAFYSGLAYHVVSMLKLADSIASLYPTLNRDLLVSGVILHDYAKIKELSDPITPEYTLSGKLVGHISMMVAELEKVGSELKTDKEVLTVLQHLVLSHHGRPEWGSAVAPQMREAEVLFLIDNLDARMTMMDRLLEYVEPGGFSERSFALDNRAFYRPKL